MARCLASMTRGRGERACWLRNACVDVALVLSMAPMNLPLLLLHAVAVAGHLQLWVPLRVRT
jgi:hypothetical protein